MTLWQGKHTLSVIYNFLVVDQPSTYNAIFGQSLMKQTNMVTVVYCLMIKFLKPTRITYFKINQVTARQCHIRSQQLTSNEEDSTIDVLAIEHNTKAKITPDSLDPRIIAISRNQVNKPSTSRLMKNRQISAPK